MEGGRNKKYTFHAKLNFTFHNSQIYKKNTGEGPYFQRIQYRACPPEKKIFEKPLILVFVVVDAIFEVF